MFWSIGRMRRKNEIASPKRKRRQDSKEEIHMDTNNQGNNIDQNIYAAPQAGVNTENAAPKSGNAKAVYVKKNQESTEKKVWEFEVLFIPTVIFAVISTFCLYKNFAGLLSAGFSLAVIILCRYVEKHRVENTLSVPLMPTSEYRGRPLQNNKVTLLYEIVIMLLCISTGLTGNGFIIGYNWLGTALLLIVRLIHVYYDDIGFGPIRYIAGFFNSIGGAFGALPDLFTDAGQFNRSEKTEKRKRTISAMIGVAIAIPLVIIVVSLLYYADFVFAYRIRETLHINGEDVVLWLMLFVFIFFATYCGLRFYGKGEKIGENKERKRFPAITAITALSLLTIIYIWFSMIQIIYLFFGAASNGNTPLSLPDGYTYAKYAREGFFQLLTVCVINLCIVIFTKAFFEESRIVKAILTTISACTYIMIASAATRMFMYIGVYNLTVNRIVVLWALATIAILLLGVIISIFKDNFPLFRFGVIVVSICYLALSFSHMEYFIASYNLAKIKEDHPKYLEKEYDYETYYYDEGEDTGNVEYTTDGYGTDYLKYLSTDAAPVILKENGRWTNTYKMTIDDVKEESLRQFNLSHFIAKKMLEN